MKKRKKGLLLAPDDLEVGRYIAVHSLKGTNQPMPYFGLASEIRAINLPFVVVGVCGSNETATVDVRYLNLMAVSEDFIKAQTPTKTQK